MKTFSLTARVTVLVCVAIVLLLGAASMLMDRMVDRQLQQHFDAELLDQARMLESLVRDGPESTSEMRSAIMQRPRQWHGAPASWAVQCSGQAAMTSDPAPRSYPSSWMRNARSQPSYADLATDSGSFRAVWFDFTFVDTRDHAAVSTRSSPAACRLIFLRSRVSLDDTLVTIDYILLVIPALALLIVMLVAPWLVRKGLQPLASLGESMRTIGPQASGNRLTSTGTRELEPLVQRFNEVLGRMDEGIAREREFTGALAHETRTRLAELRTLVEVEQRYPSERPLHDLLGNIGQIGAQLEGTVSGLLLLTRLDAGIEDTRMTSVDLRAVLHQHMDQLAHMRQKRKLQILWQPDDFPTRISADPALLDIILGNVIGNACAYASERSTVAMDWATGVLTVRNTAHDLTGDEVARFGQRFWSKHGSSGDHAGLGLALAGAAARAMGLTLDFRLDEEQRLTAFLGKF